MSELVNLSQTSKMPCKSISLSAELCITGSKLAKIPGTTCHGCYARGGCYNFPSTRNAMRRRHANLTAALEDESVRERYIAEFTRKLEGQEYFRWHDSGDIQSYEHLELICEIAQRTPWCRHWLPCREIRWANQAHREGLIPSNLTVRVSAVWVDTDKLPATKLPTSTVHKDKDPIGFECGAYQRGGKCGGCRACWDPEVRNVSYPKH